jgi:hypothetical protein
VTSSGRVVTVGELLGLLRSSRNQAPAVQRASELLSAEPPDRALDVVEVATSELITIYQRRLRRARSAAGPLLTDLEVLVSALSAVTSESLAMIASTPKGWAAYLWLTPELDHLIGCVAGVDRRGSVDQG